MVAANKRILVVDDEAIVRDSCELALTDAGYAVRTVGSGREAIQACHRERFDVVFADIRMPDMDGLEVTRVLSNEFPDLRVVIITGYPSPESAAQARNLGVFEYLQKPLSPERLSAATAEVLASPSRSAVVTMPAAPEPVAAPSAVALPKEPGPIAVPSAVPAVALPKEPGTPDAEPDMGLLRGLSTLAVAPLIGLAFVIFLPLIGFAMLLGLLGTGLAKGIGWSRP